MVSLGYKLNRREMQKMTKILRGILLLSVILIFINCPPSSGGNGGEGILALFGGGSGSQASDTPPAKLQVLYNNISQESGVTIDMGSEIINTTAGKSMVITLKNTGSQTLSLTGGTEIISLEGADASLFTVSQPTKTTLAKDETTSSTITFRPTSTGIKQARVKINSSDAAIASFLINLRGEGGPAAPRIAVNTGTTNIAANGSFSFGTEVAETPGSPITFTVRNTGSATAVLDAPVVESSNSNFVVSSSTAGANLAKDGTFTFNVTFSPNTSGSKSATITINYQIASTPTTFQFTANGTATPKPVPTIAISHNSVSYTSGGTIPTFGIVWPTLNSSAKTITITNNGTATMTGLVVSEHSGDSNDFSTSALSTGSTTLAVGASATFNVTFTPQGTGAKSMTLRISSTNGNNGAASQADVIVQGTGRTGADVLVSWTATNETAVNSADGGYKVCFSKTNNFNPADVNGTTIFCDTVANAGGTTPSSKVVTVNSFGTWYFKVFSFGKFNTTGGAPSSQSSVVVPST